MSHSILEDPLGRADIEAGDDETDVEVELYHLNTGDGAPFRDPRTVPCGASLYSPRRTGGLSMARRMARMVTISVHASVLRTTGAG
jgi:hypothetical protein